MKKVLICAGAAVVSATIAVGVRAGLKKLRVKNTVPYEE